MRLLILTILFAVTTEAQTFTKMKFHPTLQYRGTGCPAGSADWVYSPDFTSLSMIFDQNNLSLDGSYRTHPIFGTPSKNCTIDVLLIPSRGYKPKALTIDYRGAAAVANGSNLKIHTRMQYMPERAGNGSPQLSDAISELVGPADKEIFYTQKLSFKKDLKCGEAVRISLSSFLTLENITTASEDSSFVSIDSADVKTGGLSITPEAEFCR